MEITLTYQHLRNIYFSMQTTTRLANGWVGPVVIDQSVNLPDSLSFLILQQGEGNLKAPSKSDWKVVSCYPSNGNYENCQRNSGVAAKGAFLFGDGRKTSEPPGR